MKKKFLLSSLELFHCPPLWKTVLFVSSRAFSLSFLLSTPVENSEAKYMEKSYKIQQMRLHLKNRFQPTGCSSKAFFHFPSFFTARVKEKSVLKVTITASNFAPKDYRSSMGGYLLFFANKE